MEVIYNPRGIYSPEAFNGVKMKINRKELKEDIELLKNQYGLTNEELQAYLDFFEMEPASQRVINSGRNK